MNASISDADIFIENNRKNLWIDDSGLHFFPDQNIQHTIESIVADN